MSDVEAGRGRTLFVVDDDPAIRRALARLARAVGYGAETFGSAEEFLADPPPLDRQPGCILLDVSLPGLSGPQLHHRLRHDGWDVPIVYVTAHDDPATREAIAGTDAAATFAKPIEVAALLDMIGVLFERLERSSETAREETSGRGRQATEGESP
ncbi:MAG: response regulator [Gemmatimonadota bacterium]